MSINLYNKLVRDRIPEIISGDGKRCRHHIADDEEYREALLTKLLEECRELRANPCEEELADVYEVLEAISREYKLTSSSATQIAKRATKGSFNDKLILDWVED